MRTGRRVAFDIGKARVGVAISDPHGILASPREFVARASDDEAAAGALLSVLAEDDFLEIYVGLPLNLRNEPTESTKDALAMAKALQAKTHLQVRLIDERMSTKLAATAMTSIGKSTREQRSAIDSASAAVILESALLIEKTTGRPPGELISEYSNEI